MALSGRGQEIFNFIRDFRAEKGISPTYREIGAACGITSTAIVRYWLDQLEMSGLIKRHKNVPRGIVIL